eukprot:TRINITY_DN11288_c0_g1_i1.p1 TRINITY_DN11288_c0_g1~~TRINITY_DN11288_c0_g1_i1.p1  ORF type:complete len:135 (-),score=26.97 TRINITY_DN11288_c0_g1_i1:25-429(-)
MTENGSDLSLKREFLLKEGPPGYPTRTKMNVDDSDGTLVIRLHPGSGTDKTVGYAHKATWSIGIGSKMDGYRPVLVLTTLEEDNVDPIVTFIVENNIRILNIAGHRETTAGVPHFGKSVKELLEKAFEVCKVNK